ncbi:MAG: ATP-dependent RNA helicase HrpA [Thiotrichales bacterium]|jgi:ATP-dependent helicase HrpA|nr:ATP-dependent RNA helicase HrpA [Thiotrichales bacterium]
MKELFKKAGWGQKKPQKSVVAEKTPEKTQADTADSVAEQAQPLKKVPAVDHKKDLLTHHKPAAVARELPLAQLQFDDNLPVVQRAEEIITAIRSNQVVVLAGETGSGKTTQLPKLAMLAGRGKFGRIALTQPRRLAARTVAARLAEELQSPLGEWVGVKVRFHQQIADNTAIKVLTDGMLLAEIAGDRLLSEYDTIIVDEAHERSLNIDFLLGYLRQLKVQRPELHIIVTSATIDLERFSEFFDGAPIISVSGRTYPVEVRYRPLSELAISEDESVDMNVAIVRAVEELTAHDPFGDILVFLPGESDIRDATEALRLEGLKNTQILPLFARQSFADQQKIFATGGPRRIVLATNVAETSLTVPGIRHVIDSGLARIKRYSVRNKVQRLPIEAIAQASANQRKGRCGRVAPGVCIRLYSEADFLGRPAFTEPEMQRSNLASVMLQMQALGLGQLETFPLIDPPPSKLINDGYKLLEELQAVDGQGHLLPLGKQLAKLPLDPRLGRILLAAQAEGVLSEVCVLAGVLSLQDPRETPADKQQAAREKHRLFDDPRSDFLSLLNLWLAYAYQRKHNTKNKVKSWCQKHYLSDRRMREWHELVNQLHQTVSDLKWTLNPLTEKEMAADADEAAGFSDALSYSLHRALLTGLLGQIALRDERTRLYNGARGVQLAIHPSSVLAKRSAKWIMAFEWLETSRTWARLVAEIDIGWLESLAAHIIKRQVHSPYWSKKQGRVLAKETLSLYGLIIAADRPTDFGKVDPSAARNLFIRDGLVTGELTAKWPFLAKNQALMAEALTWEDKTRRSDILVDDLALAEFYQARLPENICRTADLDRWLKADASRMELLVMRKEDVFRREVDAQQDFPDQLRLANKLNLPLSYRFAPGDDADGMTIQVNLAQLPLLTEESLAKLVPGLLPQKIEAIIRALPKALRVRLQPAAEQAAEAAKVLQTQNQGSFESLLAKQLTQQAQTLVTPQDWQSVVFPRHLSPRIQLIGDDKKILATGRELADLQQQFAEQARAALREQSAFSEQGESTQGECVVWQWQQIPITQKVAGGGEAWLALIVGQEGVLLAPLPSEHEARLAHAAGVRRLVKLALAQPIAGIRKEWLKHQGLCLPWARWQRNCADLVEQLIERALIALSAQACLVRTQADFDALVAQVRPKITGQVRDYAQQTQAILQQGQQLLASCDRLTSATRRASIEDIRSFVQGRLTATFVLTMSETGWRDTPRYLKAAAYRLEKMTENLPLDERRQAEYAEVAQALAQAKQRGIAQHHPDLFLQIEQMTIELWVMIFAQPFAVKGSASLKRLQQLVSGVVGIML